MALGVGLVSTASGQPAGTGLAPFVNKPGKTTIPNQYIVVLKPGAARSAMVSAQGAARTIGGTVGFTYSSALNGFSITVPPGGLDRLRALPDVAYVEADAIVTAGTIQTLPATGLEGLDRTSERLLPLDHHFTHSHDGSGVHAYVLDSGIRTTHTEFGGRASGAFTSISDGNGTNDCFGHGTHVAGTLGGATFGIAKNVTLHAVRVLNCAGSGTISGVIAGVDWVTTNAIHPAVANMSIQAGLSAALNTAVTSSVASGVTYAVAAGNFNVDACTISPAATPTAITVGNINPTNDTRAGTSDIGPCVDLFAPGENILSAWWTSDTATALDSGTSMASPHVAGVAALHLQAHPGANPADVWTAIHRAADIEGVTLSWPGITDRGVGSPNELLHWGSVDDGYTDGDPHLRNVEGVTYDFQSAGEFVLLRDGNGLEIQTRQTPVQTSVNPVFDAYTGLATCPSINTAVAARVGEHRVSLTQGRDDKQGQGSLELRVDGVLTTLGSSGLDLGSDGRLATYGAAGLEASFADGTTLIVLPTLWTSQNLWYLHISVFHTPANEGLIGALAAGSWLPALSDGSSMGPKPAALHQRYVDLNNKFAGSWRVSPVTSLFDYAPGTSTSTFTFPSWPLENPPCLFPDSDSLPVDGLDLEIAQKLCSNIADKQRRESCIGDVHMTGEPTFANAHAMSERIELGSTLTTLDDSRNPSTKDEAVVFTAIVAKNAKPNGKPVTPTGAVQFMLDGKDAGEVTKLDRGQAIWKPTNLEGGDHQVSVRYLPARGTVFLPSTSLTRIHTVR